MDFNLRRATLDDVDTLAEMNLQLNIYEESNNNMGIPELKARMQRWLENDRHAIIVERNDDTVGYLLYYQHEEEYFPYGDSVYVRQYFISPSYRRRGIGQVAFERIVETFFPRDTPIMLDVLESNPEAKAFWQKLGFDVYNTTLRRTNK